ncbi:MAG: hypothetical protein IH978_00190 [Nitrospinae bacterium]|nr:hypothetical protein [Nitrospinota bacterium]
MSQIFRSCEANSGTIQRKGSKYLATSSASAVDQSNLGQAPRFKQIMQAERAHSCVRSSRSYQLSSHVLVMLNLVI